MTVGTLVYADSITAGDIADIHQDMLVVESQSEDENTDDDDDDNDDDSLNKSNANIFEDEASVTRNLYFAASEVRKFLRESKGITSKWPPDSHDLTTAFARQSFPVKLYNFLAWSLGFSSELVNCKIVDVTPSKDAKVLSIAQDLIYAESSGKKQTHKSLALGMAVRQMTESMGLLRILHGLGHTVSTVANGIMGHTVPTVANGNAEAGPRPAEKKL